MKDKKSLKITILSKDYTIQTDESEDCIFRAAELLNNLLNKYSRNAPLISEVQRNLLVALQLATDLTKKQACFNESESVIKELSALIDDSL